MPYYGLLGLRGRELEGEGYHRLNVERADFAMLPAAGPDHDICLQNLETLTFGPATGRWAPRALALYDEADSAVPLVSSALDHVPHMEAGDTLVVPPGSLQLTMRFGGDGPPLPPDELEADLNAVTKRVVDNLFAEVARLQTENIVLRQQLRELKRRFKHARSVSA